MDERRFTHLLCGQIHVRGRGEGDDEAIARLASRQHGLATRRQLGELGVGRRALEHRLASGRLRRRHPGVYAVGHEAITASGLALAAVMAVWPQAGASCESAAALWSLCPFPAGAVHVTAALERRPKRGVIVHRGTLPADELAFVDGVPVTTVPRTLLDLSARVDERLLRRLAKEAEFAGLAGEGDLLEILDRYPRRRGRRALARVAGWYLAGHQPTRSELEDRFLRFLADHDLPQPHTNVPLEVGGRLYELDCVWSEARLVVELDGRRAHATLVAFEEDRARDRALTAAGWRVMRITWAQLHDDPETLATQIRAALDPRLGTGAASVP